MIRRNLDNAILTKRKRSKNPKKLDNVLKKQKVKKLTKNYIRKMKMNSVYRRAVDPAEN